MTNAIVKLKNKILHGETGKFIVTVTVLALPIMAQDLVNSLVNLLDSVMVGSLGLESINAVGFSNQLFFLYSLIVFGICSGSSILTGQYWGKNDTENIHKVMGIGFSFGVAVGLLFAIIAVIFPGWFLRFYTSNPQIITLGKIYLRTIGASYLITPITMTYNFALRSIRKTNIPMITIIIALITNFIFNYVFIFIVKWGVFGAALATVTARVVEIGVQAVIIRKLKLPVVAKLKEYMSFSRKFALSCIRIITPVILNETMWALGVVLNQIAYKGAGDEAQGAMQISSAVTQLFFIAGIALGAATGIMIANELGAGKRLKAISHSRKAILFNLVIGLVMSILMLTVCPFITVFYDVSDIVKSYSDKILLVVALFMTLRIFNFTTIVGILRNGGDTRFCLFADAGATWLVAVPMAFLGVYVLKLPIHLVYALVMTEEVVKAVITGIRVFGNKWANTIV